MKTDTPRTDEQHAQFQMGGFTLDFARQLERELIAVTEQRDRLAEALRNCMPFITGDGCGEYFDAQNALAAVKGGSDE